MIITGASGFIGSFLLEELKELYYIFAIARRSSIEAHVPAHPNIEWIQWDISNTGKLETVTHYLEKQGAGDYVIHLAGFYDFDYKNKAEYYLTNVLGTKNVLELSKNLHIRRFIFASSLASCNFFSRNGTIGEKSPPNANYAYARTKKQGELLCREYSVFFRCSVVRFAAVFSDWCEYAPLYRFLSTWLSTKWNSRIIGGKGRSAITYIHICDLKNLLMKIIKKDRFLPQFDIYLASPNRPASHQELYRIATRDYYGKRKKALFVPKRIAASGVLLLNLMGKTRFIRQPFEKPWMIKYIDKEMRVDSSYTCQSLGWEPIARYHILRRMLFLLINLKSHPEEWKVKNEASLHLNTNRTNLVIFEIMASDKNLLIDNTLVKISQAREQDELHRYKYLDEHMVLNQISTFYNLLLASIRSGDRSLMIKYSKDIIFDYYRKGFKVSELRNALRIIGGVVAKHLLSFEKLKRQKQEIHDYVGLTIQLAQDAFEDLFEDFRKRIPYLKEEELTKKTEKDAREKRILKLSSPFQSYEDDDEKEERKSDLQKYSMYDMR